MRSAEWVDGCALALIEAAYRPATSPDDWLRGVLTAASPLDEGLGVTGFFFQQTGGQLAATGLLTLNGSAAWGAVLDAVTPTHAARQAANGSPSGTMSRMLARQPDPTIATILRSRALALPKELRDFWWINARDPSGFGCQLCVPLPRRMTLSRRRLELWSRVSGHLAAGLRLQRARVSAATALATGTADAVLDRRGRTQHASPLTQTPAAQSALRDAACAISRAAETLRARDPHRAVALWRALVTGRWSLLDHFDRDGKRFFIAVRNAPVVSGAEALSERERQVVAFARLGHSNKLIAYELGLQPSTVSSHLSRAAKKLGIASRDALVRSEK